MIPDSLIAPGLVCAVIFPEDQNWHRGVVTGRNAEGFVQVSILVSLTLLHLEQPKLHGVFAILSTVGLNTKEACHV